MARVKGGVNAKKRHKKILKVAKGFYLSRRTTFKAANPAVMRALRSAQMGRKLRKREFRKLWITRINAAARMNGLSYSQFMHGLKLAEVNINRKMLAEMAVNDKEGFAALTEIAKAKIA